MTLSEIIAAANPPSKRLVFSDAPPWQACEDIRSFLDIEPERVTHGDAAGGSSEPDWDRSRSDPGNPRVSVYADGRSDPLLTTDTETFRTAATSDAESLSTDCPNCPTEVLEPIGTTVVSAHSTQQMIVASRHIERRAHEIESGEIHTCFQRLSLLGEDLRTVIQYNLLAEEGVDVHIYGFADHDLPEVEKPTVYSSRAKELADSWVVAFDGTEGDADGQTAALVAQERASDEYAGFWTFDPELVENVTEYMTATYQ
jgi:DICT domain-containing protein